MNPFILAESNFKEIRDKKFQVAVLTWGATEAHNFHLPYGTDNFQIEAIAREAGNRAVRAGAELVLLPNIPFGVNTGQADIKLDINLYPSTQMAILSDILEVLNRQGIAKLIVLNGHGGNNFKPMLRELGLKYPDMLLVTTNFFQTVEKDSYFEEMGDHADEMETSLMLYLKSDLVQPLHTAGEGKEKKSRIKGIREGWAWTERRWSLVTDDTGIGNPYKATREKGERYFDAVCDKLAGLFLEVSEADLNKLYEK
ncbi:creatininase family protein [Christiangramia sabulilitoris]|uniref:Creatininase family protein n=1 Tax=Christiangramia sabulilitoris TaxID=2583991 RepID=A0A550I869_9FLAO|nr:creatininase family protein [Christiangramia sabulilitoris]TRO67146.1 creatininase family protein [Christiangramia sabulilitoris]